MAERRGSFSDGTAKSVFEDRSPLDDIPAFRKDFRGKILGTWKLFSAVGKENPVAFCDPPEALLRTTFPLGAQKRGNNRGIAFFSDKGDCAVFCFHESHEDVKLGSEDPTAAVENSSLDEVAHCFKTQLCFAGTWKVAKLDQEMAIRVAQTTFPNYRDESITRHVKHLRSTESTKMELATPVMRTSGLASEYQSFQWIKAPPSSQELVTPWIVGVWDISSFEVTKNGSTDKSFPLGKYPTGVAFYDPGGYYGIIISDSAAPVVSTSNFLFLNTLASTKECKASYQGSFALYGTYSTNSTTFVHRIWHCTLPNWSHMIMETEHTFDRINRECLITTVAESAPKSEGSHVDHISSSVKVVLKMKKRAS